MLRSEKLAQLARNAKSRGEYKATIRGLLGLGQDKHGNLSLDESKKEVDPMELSLQEMAMEFLGRNWSDKLGSVAQVASLVESHGNVVLPSHMANISAFSDSVAGLVDALVLQGYNQPGYFGDSLVTTYQRNTQGGKMIGAMNDGLLGKNLLDGEEYPAVGLKETYVEIPDLKRNGNTIMINSATIRMDLTGMVQSAATQAGEAVRRNKEVNIADVVQGITNPYSRDGKTSNTYKTTAGDKPVNYINGTTNELTTVDDLDEAFKVLGSNTDPYSGWEITVPVEGSQLVVAWHRMGRVQEILGANLIERGASTDTIRMRAPGRISGIPVLGSALWYNRLTNTVDGGSVSATNANGRWYWGHFSKAFGYQVFEAFSNESQPIGLSEARKDIVYASIAKERGVAFVVDPRYVYRGTVD